jgi:hypothetical protein
LFFTGLINAALYRLSGKRQCKNKAQEAKKAMKVLLKTKGMNSLHKWYLMKAECSASFGTKKSSSEIKESYDQAILAAGRAGFLQDAALANELAGEYFRRTGDSYWTQIHFTEARDLYREWGATQKAAHLVEGRGIYMEDGERRKKRSFNNNLSQRRWVSGEDIKMHQSLDLGHLTSQTSEISGPNSTDMSLQQSSEFCM